MTKARLLAAISSFMMLTACGSYTEDSPDVTAQSEAASVMMQSDTSARPEVATAEPQEENRLCEPLLHTDGFVLAGRPGLTGQNMHFALLDFPLEIWYN